MADLKNTYITLKLGNGGGSIDPSVLEGYATSGDMQSAFTLISETQQVAAAGFDQLESDIEEVSINVVNPCVLVSENVEDFIVDGGFKGGALFFVPMEMYGHPRYHADAFPGFLPIIEEGEWTGDFNLDQIPDMVFLPGYYGIKTFPTHTDLENQEFNPEVWKVNLNCDAGWSQDAYALKDFIKDDYDDIGVYFLIKDEENFAQYFPSPFRITGITWVDNHFELDTEEVSSVDLSAYWTSAETQDAIDESMSAYTPTANFATINGSAITDGGNIVIEGGADMSAYYTSAQTEEAISAATSGKADAASVNGNNNFQTFARWNTQGVITGAGSTAQSKSFDINGDRYKVLSLEPASWPRIWAPLSAGTAGDILVSAGNGAPVWSAVTFPDVSNYVTSAQVETQIVEKNYITSAATANMVTSTSVSTIWRGTQAQYDAIVDKDPYTFYIIVNN